MMTHDLVCSKGLISQLNDGVKIDNWSQIPIVSKKHRSCAFGLE